MKTTPRKIGLAGVGLLALTALTAIGLGGPPAQSQFGGVVQPVPAPLSPTDGSGSIATGNTFQSIFAAQGPQTEDVTNRLRRGCLIINTSNTTMYVFFGAIASAQTVKSVPLAAASADGGAGGSVTCEREGAGALQSQVSITAGTAGETFFAIRY